MDTRKVSLRRKLAELTRTGELAKLAELKTVIAAEYPDGLDEKPKPESRANGAEKVPGRMAPPKVTAEAHKPEAPKPSTPAKSYQKAAKDG